MINRKVVLPFALFGLAAIAGAKSYTLTILEPMTAGATELKPGEYMVDVNNDKAVIHKGKVSSENTVRTETVDKKYGDTSVVCDKAGEKLKIKEIHIGGTKTKLVFTESQP